MMKKLFLFVFLGFLLLPSCKESASEVSISSPEKSDYITDTLQLTEEQFYDKVLGALVGSAIGDAMGASTEMWHRNEIQLKYGYIPGLTPAIREQSPEGTWDHNLLAGATTDDTRWKYFMVKYFSKYNKVLNAVNFSKFITDYYASLTKELANGDFEKDPDLLDIQMEKVDWIKEWARVAQAFQKGATEYEKAQHRFYGGEMSCAGQLYTPMFGLFSKNPEEAYKIAYEHAIFDLGYAKDISGLVSALTNTAMRTKNMDSILNTAVFVDPMEFKNSRLVARISQNIADAARRTVLISNEIKMTDSTQVLDSIKIKVPKGYPYSQEEWVRQDFVYSFLEKDEKATAFHAGEIWQILVTALQFGNGDFEKTMRFIVNYGRDNDTVAAIAGMILGAKDGYSNLPVELRTEVLKVSKENMGIDLEVLAQEMVSN